jgi:hypothetical protein
MSKRSGMSRLEDLKRWFVDVGRHRYILQKVDMEVWRNFTCPICGEGFTKDPGYMANGNYMHSEHIGTLAHTKWWSDLYAKLDAEGYNDE